MLDQIVTVNQENSGSSNVKKGARCQCVQTLKKEIPKKHKVVFKLKVIFSKIAHRVNKHILGHFC